LNDECRITKKQKKQDIRRQMTKDGGQTTERIEYFLLDIEYCKTSGGQKVNDEWRMTNYEMQDVRESGNQVVDVRGTGNQTTED
jgi:hypothetical protein